MVNLRLSCQALSLMAPDAIPPLAPTALPSIGASPTATTLMNPALAIIDKVNRRGPMHAGPDGLLLGGHYWIRTSDPYPVKVVL